MHNSHCMRMFIALGHDHGVLRVSWQILCWSLLRFYVSPIRVMVTLVFTICLSWASCIADNVRSKFPLHVMWYLASAISAKTVTRLIGVHVQSDVSATPHAPTYRNSSSTRTIWMYFHAADMSSIYSAELTWSMTRLVDIYLIWNINVALITPAIDNWFIFTFSAIAWRWNRSWCCMRCYNRRVIYYFY